MQLVSREPAGHWYTKTGEPAYTQVKKDGGIRNTTLADARKQNLYPSITTILKLIAKPELDAWKQEQAILSALTLPRIDSESEEDFAKRIVKDSSEQGRSAADFGSIIHDIIHNYFMNKVEPEDSRQVAMNHEIEAMLAKLNLEVVSMEQVTVGNGFAGKYDMLAKHSTTGKYWFIDFKTQDFKDKPNVYDEWIWQLEGYSLDSKYAEEVDGAINIVIKRSDVSDVAAILHPKDVLKQGRQIFLTIFQLWKLIKGYDPVVGET